MVFRLFGNIVLLRLLQSSARTVRVPPHAARDCYIIAKTVFIEIRIIARSNDNLTYINIKTNSNITHNKRASLSSFDVPVALVTIIVYARFRRVSFRF